MFRQLMKCLTFRQCKTTDKLLAFLLVFFYLTMLNWSREADVLSENENKFLQHILKPSSTSGYDYNNPFVYALPHNRSVKGLEFSVDPSVFKSLLVSKDQYITLTMDNAPEFVFATGASEAFYPMLEEAVASIQHHRPKNKILVYDLGLAKDQVEIVKTWCNVLYRKFNFTNFPKHVRNLATYAWKPLIIMDVLKDYPGVLWMDSSVRVIMSNFSGLFEDVVKNSGGVSLTTSGHSTYAATHPKMYSFLPIDLEAIKREEQREATLMFYRTRHMYDYVLRWLAMCALEKDCIAPTFQRGCLFRGDNRRRWGHCHRFDQSAVNILFMNYFGYDSWKYYAKTRVVKIERFVSGEFKVKNSKCPTQKRPMLVKAKITRGKIILPRPSYKTSLKVQFESTYGDDSKYSERLIKIN